MKVYFLSRTGKKLEIYYDYEKAIKAFIKQIPDVLRVDNINILKGKSIDELLDIVEMVIQSGLIDSYGKDHHLEQFRNENEITIKSILFEYVGSDWIEQQDVLSLVTDDEIYKF